MATITEFPFSYPTSIETYADFSKLAFIFYSDDAGTIPVDYSGSTFEGEVLTKIGGTKLFDFTFNTPANDGTVWPQLDEADTATLTGNTCHYFVKVITGSADEAYFSGNLTVSSAFKPGTV